MRFALLGPVRVGDGGWYREIGGPMPRTVLATLLLQANLPVSADHLSEVLWAGHPPASAIASLHNHVTRLRRILGEGNGGRIRAVPPGYLIRVEPGELDIDVFAGLCGSGRRAAAEGRWADAERDLAAALGQWHGQPLADVPGLDGHARIGHLLEARTQALEGRIEAELHLGRHHEAIGELRALTAEHPLREVFREQLMLALYRAGSRAEALDVFHDLRSVLVEELGIEPSAASQNLHHRILNDDPSLTLPTTITGSGADPASSEPAHPAPADENQAGTPEAASPGPVAGTLHQLPPAGRVFAGRARELGELIALAGQADVGARPGTVVISAIDGMAGIGKTAIAVRAAHRLAERFPDGQLFLDLHGYTEGLPPREPADALAAVLRALGFPPSQIPADLDARTALYRDRLTGTRTLILLDNAATEAQVRPLLPSSPGCLVLITSRRRLKGLDDAHYLPLDLLPLPDAVALFSEAAGFGPARTEDPLLDEIAALCGRLPLALRVAAALIRHRPAWTLERLADKLRDQQAALGQFSDGDRNLPAVFDLSYAALDEDQQLLFRRLGLVPGPDADAYAAAALIDADSDDAEAPLQDLVDHNLLTEPVQGRYQLHDLLRVHARSKAGQDDLPEEREKALNRLLDYYQFTAQRADSNLARLAPVYAPPVACPPRSSPDVADWESADAWLATEMRNLEAAVELSLSRAQPTHAVALPLAMHEYLRNHGPWHLALALQSTAEQTSRRLADQQGEAAALTNAGIVRWVSTDYAGAAGNLKQALGLYLELGDLRGQALVRNNLGVTLMQTGNYPGAIRVQEQALELYRILGDIRGQALARNNIAIVLSRTGDYHGAIRAHRRTLEHYEALGSLRGQATTLNNLGTVLWSIGDLPGTADALSRALDLYRTLGDPHGQALTLNNLGIVWTRLGDYAGAGQAHKQALADLRKLGDRQGQAMALDNLANLSRCTEDYRGAIEAYEQAVQLFHRIGDRAGEAESHIGCAQAFMAIGDLEKARTTHGAALSLAREIAAPSLEADALAGLGEVSLAEGALAEGGEFLKQALEIYRRHGLPAADEVEQRLAGIQAPDGDRPAPTTA